MTDSLHPGSGGNTGFNTYDLDNDLRKVFYPASVGWILLGVWISTLFIRLQLIEKKNVLHESQ
jgi:heme exporter protein C